MQTNQSRLIAKVVAHSVLVLSCMPVSSGGQEPQKAELQQHQEAALESLKDWKTVAQRMLETRKLDFQNSNARKIKQMAEDLRAEYAKVLERWESLSSDTTISDAERGFRQHQLRAQLSKLQTTWDTLGIWPFNPAEEPPSEQQRAFELQTQLLLSTYGDVDEVRLTVETLKKQLERLTPEPIEFVARNELPDSKRLRLYLLAGGGKTPSVFSQPIGPAVAMDSPSDFTIANTPLPQPGPFARHRGSVTPLVRFVTISDGRLRLDRDHWLDSETIGYESSEDRIDLVDGLLLKYQVGDHLAYSKVDDGQVPPFNASPDSDAPVAHRFDKLAKESQPAGGGSSSGGGIGDQFHRRFHHREMSGTMEGTPTEFSLSLIEQIAPKRRLQLATDDESGWLSFTIETENEILHVTQHSDGTVRMVAGPLEEIVTLYANDFASLYKQHPDEVERLFIYRCRQFGIGGLPMRADHTVQQAVLRRLKTLEAGAQRTQELITKLGSNRFDEWFAAQQELKLDFPMHEDAIGNAQKNNSTSAIAQERLEELLAKRSAQNSATDWIIRELKLLNDVDYLTALPAEGDASELVQRRLQSLQ